MTETAKFGSIRGFEGKIQKIETLGLPNDPEVINLLSRAAKQVEPIMKKRSWTVPLLKELLPENRNLEGLNENKGECILVRVRRAKDTDTLYDFEHVLGTLLHELVHIVHGPHHAGFYKLLEEITIECESLIGSGDSFIQNTGHKLNLTSHNPSLSEAKHKAVEAAEKRMLYSKLGAGESRVLGGPKNKTSDPREAVRLAIEKRFADSLSCGVLEEMRSKSEMI